MLLSKLKVNHEQESIRIEMQKLPDEIRARAFSEIGDKLRDPDTYAVLNYALVTGLHHFYLGKFVRGTLELAAFLTGLYMIFRGGTEVNGYLLMYLGIVIVGILVVVELVELFRSQIVVQDFNNRVSRKVLDKYLGSSAKIPEK